jgi:hypothetical protein
MRPTGFEPAEFIDIPATVEEDHPRSTHGPQSGPAYLRGMPVSAWTDATTGRRPLSDQTRVNITRWAEEYISALVQNHHGDSDDVRAVIHDLHLECTQAHDQ